MSTQQTVDTEALRRHAQRGTGQVFELAAAAADEIDRLRAQRAAVASVARQAIEVHAEVGMDTEEDRRLHDEVVEALRTLLAVALVCRPAEP